MPTDVLIALWFMVGCLVVGAIAVIALLLTDKNRNN